MAANIYGYQGVHTPLESVTQGRYTLSDYTSMRTELSSRLVALENQGGFVPTNVTITGFLEVVPGSGGTGQIVTPSSVTCYSASIGQGGCTIEKDLTVGGILSGDGSLLTNVPAVDPSKLPLAGGNLTGPLSATSIYANGNIEVAPSSHFIGNGSGLYQVNDITKLPLAGGTLTGDLVATNVYCNYIAGNGAGLVNIDDDTKLPLTGGIITGALQTQAITCTIISGNGSGLSNVIGTDPSKLNLQGGTLTGDLISKNINANGNITVNGGYSFSGNGQGLTNIDDITKLPKTGGTMTGTLVTRDVYVDSGYTLHGDGSNLTNLPHDSTKLDTTGGWLGGPLWTRDVTIQAPYHIYGDGSQLTNLPSDNSKLSLSGGTVTGDLVVQAHVYANYLVGDGSGITNVSVSSDASKLNINGSNSMTGTLNAKDIVVASGSKYYGDGSALSNVPPDASKLNVSGGQMTGSINFSSSSNSNRAISLTYINLADEFNTGYVGTIFASGNSMYYDNNKTGGAHQFAANNSGGTQSIPLNFDTTNMYIATTNPPTCTANQPLPSDSGQYMPTTSWVQSAINNKLLPLYTYTSASNIILTANNQEQVFQVAQNYGCSFSFSSYYFGQKFIFIRPQTATLTGLSLGLSAGGPLVYRALFLNGVITNVTSTAVAAAMSYEYPVAGQYKIRSTFIVLPTTSTSINPQYAFDFVEIA